MEDSELFTEVFIKELYFKMYPSYLGRYFLWLEIFTNKIDQYFLWLQKIILR